MSRYDVQGSAPKGERFESVESQQASALREIAAQLKRLNDKLDAISGFGVSETEHIRIVDMSREPY